MVGQVPPQRTVHLRRLLHTGDGREDDIGVPCGEPQETVGPPRHHRQRVVLRGRGDVQRPLDLEVRTAVADRVHAVGPGPQAGGGVGEDSVPVPGAPQLLDERDKLHVPLAGLHRREVTAVREIRELRVRIGGLRVPADTSRGKMVEAQQFPSHGVRLRPGRGDRRHQADTPGARSEVRHGRDRFEHALHGGRVERGTEGRAAVREIEEVQSRPVTQLREFQVEGRVHDALRELRGSALARPQLTVLPRAGEEDAEIHVPELNLFSRRGTPVPSTSSAPQRPVPHRRRRCGR